MSNVQEVLSQLRNLEDFMKRHAVKAWSDKLRNVRQQATNNLQELKRQVLDMYRGSMGSLTDLIISRVNGHEVDDEKAANAQLDNMVHELWERANRL
jgi:hypothetical protein